MKRVYAKHLPYTNGHYAKVFHDMEVAGEPTIRVLEYKGKYCAVEGSHRIAACHDHGLIPKLVVLKEDLEGRDDYWDKVLAGLPFYDFDHVMVLNLKVMEKELMLSNTI